VTLWGDNVGQVMTRCPRQWGQWIWQ